MPQQREVNELHNGFHNWFAIDGEAYGSFEVFYRTDAACIADGWGAKAEGWYWWACWPGCLPDGEPNGPFPNGRLALEDAIRWGDNG